MTKLKRKHNANKKLLDLTPMVDVALTLVVFLLLNSQRDDVKQLPVILPSSNNGITTETEPLELFIDKAGNIRINGENIKKQELINFVKEKTLSLYADKSCMHGIIIEVLDELHQAGATSIYYATEQKNEEW